MTVNAEGKIRKITCSSKVTVGQEIFKLDPGDTLLVTGTCNENIVIPEDIAGITLDGQGTAAIYGGLPTTTGADTIRIMGRGITIQGFTVTGGRYGINLSKGASATIDHNNISYTGQRGIDVADSSAFIKNNVIHHVPSDGIFITRNSGAQIGFDGPNGARINYKNDIYNCGGSGIRVSRSSYAQIGYNTIRNNGYGIRIQDNATAQVGGIDSAGPSGNTIESNGGGVSVQGSSSATISENIISNNSNYGVLVGLVSQATMGYNTISGKILAVQNSGLNGVVNVNGVPTDIISGTVCVGSGAYIEGIIVNCSPE